MVEYGVPPSYIINEPTKINTLKLNLLLQEIKPKINKTIIGGRVCLKKMNVYDNVISNNILPYLYNSTTHDTMDLI